MFWLYRTDKYAWLQNQSVFCTLTALGAEPQVLLDPNQLSVDGTVALSGLAISDDGRMMAYGLSTSGSDWQEWKVRDVETGEDLSDRLKWIEFSDVSWVGNNQGCFYSRYDEPDDLSGAFVREVALPGIVFCAWFCRYRNAGRLDFLHRVAVIALSAAFGETSL